MSSDILIINLQAYGVDCRVCGQYTDTSQGIPMYEDYVLPDDWQGEWFGQPACQRCVDAQAALTEPVPVDQLCPRDEGDGRE